MSTATVPPARSFLNGSTGATPSRTEAVLDAIKHAILAGELRPGQSLVETELAQLLGVSKTPVREALKTLAGAGLVTMSPYRGATVRTIDTGERGGHLRSAAAAGTGGGAPGASSPARAVGGRTGRPMGDRQAALAASDAAADQAQRSLANRDFHRALYLACGNSLLVKILDDLRDQTALVSALSWEQAPSWHAGGSRAPGHPGRGAGRCGRRGGGPAPRAHRGLRGPAFPDACASRPAARHRMEYR